LKARDEIMTMLQEQSNDVQRIDVLLDILIDSKEPFREKQLGGGPWQVHLTEFSVHDATCGRLPHSADVYLCLLSHLRLAERRVA